MSSTPWTLDSRSARGLMLGLLLGDALGAVAGRIPPGAAPLQATSAGQLACTTVEGLIRASVRYRFRGICHPPSVVWHALVRWAWGQGITAEVAFSAWRDGAPAWPDGFLSEVPLLRERRGSAAETVAALRVRGTGGPKAPKPASEGFHGLVRTLPVALQAPGSGGLHHLAQEVAALTHGARAGHLPAADAVVFLAEALRTRDVRAAVEDGLETLGASVEGPTYLIHYEDAIHAGGSAARSGADADRLHRARTAMPTLCDALYVVTAFPEPDRIFEALRFAADHSTAGTAAVVGAVLGACHGPDALPTAAVSRLELGWVADVLAQDLVRESVDRPRQPVPPGVVQFEDTPDPDWWARYPGW